MSARIAGTGAPTLRFLLSGPAPFIALGFGTGLARWAPGTVATLATIPLAALLWSIGSDALFVAFIVLLFVVGTWAAQRTGAALGAPDHRSIVVDEIAAFLPMLFLTGPSLARVAFAFLLFRLFDIVKPPPIRTIDQRLKNGVGAMLDDVVAAAFALLIFAAVVRVTGWPA
ncbi:MAG TPA: phosphatidylglycerophosphatase A [Casimicrobiaceae bacterium]|nr:phosphatidylglycerophosphatase A [Casimicrobiaceae bacterium]